VNAVRIGEAARLLGVSDDTVRRWADSGRLPTHRVNGRMVVNGPDLAAFAITIAVSGSTDAPVEPDTVSGRSARNRFPGIVTKVIRDTVMAQVEIQAGPHRVVSLMSREAADELNLTEGVLAIASVKSTQVVIEIPDTPGPRRKAS
jgi:molybdopterin-binding protein